MNDSLTKDRIRELLLPVFNKTFGHAEFLYDDNVNATDINEWDSLRHMLLISEVEKTFNIKIAPTELFEAKSIKKLLFIIEKKCMQRCV